MSLARADDEIVDPVSIDVADRHAGRSVEIRERRDGRYQAIAVAVEDLDRCRMARRARNRHRVVGDGGNDVDEHHQPIVFVVEPMAMQHVQAQVVDEVRAHRQRTGLNDRLLRSHQRRGNVGVVLAEHLRSQFRSGRWIVVLGHLEVVDVDVNRMRVVIVVDEVPLFDRPEPRLNQRNVGKRVSVERVHERLGIGVAGVIVEKPAVDEQRAAHVGFEFRQIVEGRRRVELLSGVKRRSNALPVVRIGIRAAFATGR